VGKTTVCQVVAELARRRGYRPGGVITPALYSSHGAKLGFEAVDVGSGERWPLAHTDQKMGGPRVGPYSFDPTGMARALKVLERAISAGCDLLMVDEIGPLELEQGEGFAPILELLPSAAMESRPTAIRNLLIVVRPALLDQLLRHLRGTQCSIFSVTEENRDELPLRIVEKLWGNEVALCSVIRDFRAFCDLRDDD
jgi:nucleoside-triphosphatase THEP1